MERIPRKKDGRAMCLVDRANSFPKIYSTGPINEFPSFSRFPPRFDLYPERTNVYFISVAMKRIPVLSLSLSFFSPPFRPLVSVSFFCEKKLERRRTLWVCCAKWDRPRIYSTANYHSADGLFALRIRRLRATIAAISVSDDARCLQISVIDYEPPRPFRTRRILQAGWMLPTVINYGRTLSSIHGIRDPCILTM